MMGVDEGNLQGVQVIDECRRSDHVVSHIQRLDCQPEKTNNEQDDAGRLEPVSRGDQILRLERGKKGNIYFPVQLTPSRIDNLTRLISTLIACKL